MSQFYPEKIILKGESKRAYNLSYQPEQVFAYITDFKVLYSNVPYVTKIQLRKNSGRARLFCSVNILGVESRTLIDVEPLINQAEKTIQMQPPAEPLGPLPPGYIFGTFNSLLRVTANDKGGTRFTTQIALAFDARQFEILNYFSGPFLETTAQPFLQQLVDDLSSSYMSKLLEGLRDKYKNSEN